MNLEHSGRRPKRQPARDARSGEDAAQFDAEVIRCASRINEQIARLNSVSAHAYHSAGDLRRNATADELRYLAAQLRGVTGYAFATLSEILAESGRLELLAMLREL